VLDRENNVRYVSILETDSTFILQGLTALHWSCGQGKIAVAEILIAHGADANLKDKVSTESL
jgi:ankyrin repeat protein